MVPELTRRPKDVGDMISRTPLRRGNLRRLANDSLGGDTGEVTHCARRVNGRQDKHVKFSIMNLPVLQWLLQFCRVIKYHKDPFEELFARNRSL
jgi:hypothetical protein